MNDIKLIFHIGMGKTGTTSIQWAMENNQKALADQGVCYLGMWLDMIDPEFEGLAGTVKFLLDPPDLKAGYAQKFVQHVRELNATSGASTFILSNEGLFERPGGIIPFLRALSTISNINVKAYAYLRDPAGWLRSAYAQWGLKHKTVQGPIRPFSSMAPNLLKQYSCAVTYHEKIPDIINLRHFDEQPDVVAAFCSEVGLVLEGTTVRKLPRDETAELVLRREFNNLFQDAVLPGSFDNAAWGNTRRDGVASIDDIVLSFDDNSTISAAIADNFSTFAYLNENLNLNLNLTTDASRSVDVATVRNRMIDYLMHIVVRQSLRIARLESDFSNSLISHSQMNSVD